MLRRVIRDINTDFQEGGDGVGVHVARGLGARAVDGDEVRGGGVEDAFGHVAAAGVAGAEDEDGGFHDGGGECW